MRYTTLDDLRTFSPKTIGEAISETPTADVAPAVYRPRLIDARQIRYSWMIDDDGEEHDGVTLQSIIDKMPTVDAVEVVRCKNCCHYHPYSKPVEDFDGECCVRGCETDEEEYCSYGRRKEHNNECE